MTESIPAPPLCRRCWRQHRGWRTLAGCVLGPLEWVSGEGPWGSVADCPRGRTVMLFPTREEAEAAKAAKAMVDKTRCGGMCVGHHRVTYIGEGVRP